jgi:hypothetical protein
MSWIVIAYLLAPIIIAVVCSLIFRRFETATYVATGCTLVAIFGYLFLSRGPGSINGWDAVIAVVMISILTLGECGLVALGIRLLFNRMGPHYLLGHCMRCGHSLANNDTDFCKECGKPIGAPVVNCKQCGYDLTGLESGVCPECGTAVDSPR